MEKESVAQKQMMEHEILQQSRACIQHRLASVDKKMTFHLKRSIEHLSTEVQKQNQITIDELRKRSRKLMFKLLK